MQPTSFNYILTVAVSTVGERIVNAQRIIEKLGPHENVEYILVHQAERESQRDGADPLCKYRLVFSNTFGAAASRNLALKNATGDYLWFLDDDITIADDAITRILKLLADTEPDIAVLNLQFNDDLTSFEVAGGDNQIPIRPLKKHELTRIGTPQIVVRTVFGRRSIFPENYGAGTKNGIGDEPLYLAPLYLQAERAVRYMPVIMKHQVVSSGHKHRNKIFLRVRIYLKVYGFFGFVKFCGSKALDAFNRQRNA